MVSRRDIQGLPYCFTEVHVFLQPFNWDPTITMYVRVSFPVVSRTNKVFLCSLPSHPMYGKYVRFHWLVMWRYLGGFHYQGCQLKVVHWTRLQFGATPASHHAHLTTPPTPCSSLLMSLGLVRSYMYMNKVYSFEWNMIVQMSVVLNRAVLDINWRSEPGCKESQFYSLPFG